MNEDTSTYRITIDSTPDVLITAMHTNLCHMYQNGDKETAIEFFGQYFLGMVEDGALARILSGTVEPEFDMEDIVNDRLSFTFEKDDLKPKLLSELDKAT